MKPDQQFKCVCNWSNRTETTTRSDRLADKVSSFIGSWNFLIIQSSVIVAWVVWNLLPNVPHFDSYPFIFLTLVLSLQAAYAAPIIMMSQNRQAIRDRIQAEEDYSTDVAAKMEIEQLQIALARIEDEKLNKIIAILNSRAE